MLVVLALSFPAGLVVQHIVTLYGGPPHELPIDHAYIPLYVFIAGVIFAILTFVVIEWFRKVMRNKGEKNLAHRMVHCSNFSFGAARGKIPRI